MKSIAAEQAKDRGNKQFSAGNYRDAISCFDEAIAIAERESAENMHVYFSNRSAAYLSLGEATKALEDAESCIDAKNDWAKGYSRKGAALFTLKRFKDAVVAYQQGLQCDPTNAVLLKGKRDAEQHAVRSSNSAAPAASSGSVKGFVMKDRAAIVRSIQFILRLFALVQIVLYLVPFLSPIHYHGTFGTFFKLSSLNCLVALSFAHGRPKFTSEFAFQVFHDPTTHLLMYCLFFWSSQPMFMATVPVLFIELVHICWYLNALLGLIRSPLLPPLSKGVDLLAGKLIRHPQWANLSSSAKWQQANTVMPARSSFLMVVIGLSFLVELLTPLRSFSKTFIYWQYLRITYALSPLTQKAFGEVDQVLLLLFNNPRCPGALRNGYFKLKGFLHKMSNPQQQAQQPRSPFSSCNVM